MVLRGAVLYFRERLQCRRVINVLLERHNCDLEDLLTNKYRVLGKGLKMQCKKMLQEREMSNK